LQAGSLPLGNRSSLWHVFGTGDRGPSFRSQFEPLAMRAGLKLNPQSTQPVELWLSAIKGEGPQIEMLGPSVSMFQESGYIRRLCQASTDLCNALESRALAAERAGDFALSQKSDLPTCRPGPQSTDHGQSPDALVESQLPSAVPASNRGNQSAARPFSHRANWFSERLKERAWNRNDPARHNGPDPKTIDRILKGSPVRPDVLERLANALSAKGAKVTLLDIPDD
jgi:hypothetical protein